MVRGARKLHTQQASTSPPRPPAASPVFRCSSRYARPGRRKSGSGPGTVVVPSPRSGGSRCGPRRRSSPVNNYESEYQGFLDALATASQRRPPPTTRSLRRRSASQVGHQEDRRGSRPADGHPHAGGPHNYRGSRSGAPLNQGPVHARSKHGPARVRGRFATGRAPRTGTASAHARPGRWAIRTIPGETKVGRQLETLGPPNKRPPASACPVAGRRPTRPRRA